MKRILLTTLLSAALVLPAAAFAQSPTRRSTRA